MMGFISVEQRGLSPACPTIFHSLYYSSPITEAERSKRRRTQLAEKISNKLHALLWAVVGITVAVQTDFVRVLLGDERVNR